MRARSGCRHAKSGCVRASSGCLCARSGQLHAKSDSWCASSGYLCARSDQLPAKSDSWCASSGSRRVERDRGLACSAPRRTSTGREAVASRRRSTTSGPRGAVSGARPIVSGRECVASSRRPIAPGRRHAAGNCRRAASDRWAAGSDPKPAGSLPGVLRHVYPRISRPARPQNPIWPCRVGRLPDRSTSRVDAGSGCEHVNSMPKGRADACSPVRGSRCAVSSTLRGVDSDFVSKLGVSKPTKTANRYNSPPPGAGGPELPPNAAAVWCDSPERAVVSRPASHRRPSAPSYPIECRWQLFLSSGGGDQRREVRG
jgi:hypothetical protein